MLLASLNDAEGRLSFKLSSCSHYLLFADLCNFRFLVSHAKFSICNIAFLPRSFIVDVRFKILVISCGWADI